MGLPDPTVVEMRIHLACLPGGRKSVPQAGQRQDLWGIRSLSPQEQFLY